MEKSGLSKPTSAESSSAGLHTENKRIANKYRPYLVLFPEIMDGTQRENYHHSGHTLGSNPPLDYDYHPRDIRFVLDNACLPPTGIHKYLRYLGIRRKKPSREKLLEEMSKNEIKHIDLIDEKGPKDVNKFWHTYACIKNKDKNPEYQRKAYARVVRGHSRFEDYISIQYWLAYFFDDWANVHEMDWEMVSVILEKAGSVEKPIACVYNAHTGSFRKPWEDVLKVDDEGNSNPQGLHPVAYIANGSHASYFSDYTPAFNVGEKYLKPALRTVIRLAGIAIGTDFIDYVPSFEEGDKHFPEIEVVSEPDKNGCWSKEWRWLNFKGKWGSPAELSIKERLLNKIPIVHAVLKIFKRPIRESGPPGPNARPDSCWNKPFVWVNLECINAEKSGNWLAEISDVATNKR